MNTLKLIKLGLVCFLPLATVARSTETNFVFALPNDAGVTQGIKLFLTFPKTTFTNGEPILAWGVLTNQTESPVSFFTPSVGVDLTLSVTNAKGFLVASIDNRHGRSVSPGDLVLPPHGCITNSIQIDKFYSLKSGVYQIYAKWDITLLPPWGKKILTSPVVTIKIIGVPKKP